jgi:hypothetical protein
METDRVDTATGQVTRIPFKSQLRPTRELGLLLASATHGRPHYAECRTGAAPK